MPGVFQKAVISGQGLKPTEEDRKRAAMRASLAKQENERLAIARTICGKAKRYALWRLIDNLGKLPDRVIYCADYGDDKGWTPACPNDTERQPGSNLYRWRHCFNFVAASGRTYKPKSAEQLADAREKRAERKPKQLDLSMP